MTTPTLTVCEAVLTRMAALVERVLDQIECNCCGPCERNCTHARAQQLEADLAALRTGHPDGAVKRPRLHMVDVTVHQPVCLTADVLVLDEKEAFEVAKRAVLARVRAEDAFADPRVRRLGDESLTDTFNPETVRVDCYLAEVEDEPNERSDPNPQP
jgi:hypothetical protein